MRSRRRRRRRALWRIVLRALERAAAYPERDLPEKRPPVIDPDPRRERPPVQEAREDPGALRGSDAPHDPFAWALLYPPASAEPEGSTNDGELDSVVCATLDLPRVAALGTSLTAAVQYAHAILSDVSVFRSLFLPTAPPLPHLPGPPSRFTALQVTRMQEMGVVAHKRHRDPVAAVLKGFTVRKPSGKLRIIVDASPLGRAQERPPNPFLPSVEEIKELVRVNEYVTQLDGKSWFYQFPAQALAQFFTLRTAAGLVQLRVLAMGWSWSVWIAQTVASALVEGATSGLCGVSGVVYVDNFLLFGASRSAACVGRENFLCVAERCGAHLKGGGSAQPQQQEVILGMSCDLAAKTVSLAPVWLNRFVTLWRVYTAGPGRFPLKYTWKVLGCILWGMRVLGVPMVDVIHLRQWMSRTARRLARGTLLWTSRTPWWPAALRCLRRVVSILCVNEPVSVSLPPVTQEETLWCDASGRAGAYILQDSGTQRQLRWTARQLSAPIHVKEAWAVEAGVRCWVATRHCTESLAIMTDNMIVRYALERGTATGFLLAQSISNTLAMLRGIVWSVTWVPSADQRADYLSRAL